MKWGSNKCWMLNKAEVPKVNVCVGGCQWWGWGMAQNGMEVVRLLSRNSGATCKGECRYTPTRGETQVHPWVGDKSWFQGVWTLNFD